jgi:hypothetical protein
MAINKTAHNLNIKIKDNYISNAKSIYEESRKIEIVATKENLTLTSNKKIIIRGNKS